MKISFVIPVLNGEKFMAACIESIIAEMSEGDEIIVVDNGSTDGTLEILSRYSAAKVLRAPGITIGAARNMGSRETTGEIFAFIDSDCLLCSGWRQAVVKTLEDEAIAVTGSKYDIPANPHWIERAWYSKRSLSSGPTNYINSGNLVVRRQVYESIDGFDERLVTDEDYDFGERARKAGFSVFEQPQIRTIHLGNPKSLAHFYRKERWHATSSLSALKRGKLDKPTAMTLFFMLSCIASLAALALSFRNPWWLIAIPILLLAIPGFTALYRIWQFRNPRYFFPLVVLYLLFYISRSAIILKLPFSRTD